MGFLEAVLLSWMLVVYIVETEACTLNVENVNCADKELTNIHYTCQSSSWEKECSCTFDNPLQTELGWYKMCKTKTHLRIEKKKLIRTRRQAARHSGSNCGTMQPPRPGKASCFVTAGEIVCKGECDANYQFVDGAKEHSYSCQYSEGIWKPKAAFPACEPVCVPPCKNDGNCTDPNYCSCTSQFRGNSCQYALKLCGLSRNRWLASSWQCNHYRIETVCNISCHAPGTIEALRDFDRYVCSLEGKWRPTLPRCVQAVQICEDPGTIQFGRRQISTSSFTVGSWISFYCDGGYVISGEQKITCQSDGQWSPEMPQCIIQNVSERRIPEADAPSQCPKPLAPKNSIVEFSFPDQNPLQTLFNSELPFIQRLTISLRANSSRNLNTGLARLPESLFQVGTRVQYKCKNRFYRLYGSEYQTCLLSGTWSGYQPACVPECGRSGSPKSPFVVNGNVSLIGQWPWIVGLVVNGSRDLRHICGGVLISENWVLTAAHCVTKRLTNVPMNEKNILIYCGKYYRKFSKDDEYVQVKQVKQVIIHEEYDFTHYDADIALLQLESEVELTTRVQPICLPTESTMHEHLKDGQKGIVLGWGLTENGTFSETLRETILPVVGHDTCEEAYREGLRTITVTQNMFCAGYKNGSSDTCHGDSGGPFMFSDSQANDRRWYLEGLVSWGSESGCAESNLYSGFTKVGRFVAWINMLI